MRGVMILVFVLLAACQSTPAVTPTPAVLTATAPPPTATTTLLPPSETPPPPTATNTFTPTPEQTAIGQIAAESVSLYDLPGGEIIRIVRGTAPLTLDGRTADASWVRATFADGVTGWLPQEVIETGVETALLPIIDGVDSAPYIALNAEGTPLPTITPTIDADAFVLDDAGGLRLRAAPNTDSEIIANLDSLTPLTVYGRTPDNSWLRVQDPDGQIGWVVVDFLDVSINLSQVAVAQVAPTPPPASGPSAASLPDPNIAASGGVQQIFLRGQGMGNRPNVFSKIGDGLTTSPHSLIPFGVGDYNLAEYSNLQPTVDFFTAVNARDGNSFSNFPIAAAQGWTTESVLDRSLAPRNVCGSDETPLACEYRIVKPAIALIMLGTNDVANIELGAFQRNMTQIIQFSVDSGVIPAVSTIPPRDGYDVTPYNQVIRQLASEFDVPLWDTYDTLRGLPDQGLARGGKLLSNPPDGAGDLSAENLRYGYVVRNLLALQTLDALRQSVLTAN